MLITIIFLQLVLVALLLMFNPKRSILHREINQVETHPDFVVPEAAKDAEAQKLIAIIMESSMKNFKQNGAGAVETWIADAMFPVILHVRDCQKSNCSDEIYALNAYAEKITGISSSSDFWHVLSSNGERFNFTLLLEPSSYVNLRSIDKTLDYLLAEDHTLRYIGLPRNNSNTFSDSFSKRSIGRENDCVKEGGGVLLGQQLVQIISLKRQVKQHFQLSNIYDELGVFARKYGWIKCENMLERGFTYTGELKRNLGESDAEFSLMPQFFDVPWLYPVDRYRVFRKIHAQSQYYLRPIQGFGRQFKRNSISLGSCVHNPSMELHHVPGFYLPECPSLSHPTVPKLKDIPTFALNLPNEKEQFDQLSEGFSKLGIRVNRFVGVVGNTLDESILKSLGMSQDIQILTPPKLNLPLNKFPSPFVIKPQDLAFDKLEISPLKRAGLKPGEIGYRLSMQQLLMYALQSKLPYIMVLDDDAVPHCNFVELWKQVVSCSRCVPVFADYRYQRSHENQVPSGHGVLMVGAAVWNEGTYPYVNLKDYYGGWKMADHDVANHTFSSSCFNLNNRTFGSFGVIYPYSSYEIILDWMDKEAKPFDWVFEYLAIQGFPVRVSMPNLIIQNVGHKSRVDPNRKHTENVSHRAKLHRWNLTEYCEPDGTNLSRLM